MYSSGLMQVRQRLMFEKRWKKKSLLLLMCVQMIEQEEEEQKRRMEGAKVES